MHGHMYVSMQTHIATCTQKHSTLYTTHRHTNILYVYTGLYIRTHIYGLYVVYLAVILIWQLDIRTYVVLLVIQI